MSAIDRVTEAASRWMAARTSRRHFLGGVGKVAVLASGGAVLSQLFAARAEARVCGQSGVSPRCPTFDCYPPAFWGWCWYSSPGCCSNGGLKKICDCCLSNHPNVQGYCPDGTSVFCVVESCLEDPRVMNLGIERMSATTIGAMSLVRSRTRPERSAEVVVVGDGTDALVAALAWPVAGELGAPLLLAEPAGDQGPLLAEVRRLGCKRVVVVGAVSGDVVRALRDSVDVERTNDLSDVASMSVMVGGWLLRRNGQRLVYVIGAGGEAAASAAGVAALAMAARAPVLIGLDAFGAMQAASGPLDPVFVGPEVRTGSGGLLVDPGDGLAVLAACSRLALERAGTGKVAVAMVPASAVGLAAGMVSPGGMVSVHDDGVATAGLRDWCAANRARVGRVELAIGVPGALPDQGIYDLQSAFNGFAAHLLTGVAGEGLPVFAQPMEERLLGKARVSGPLPPPTPTTIVSRANPARRVTVAKPVKLKKS